jgi:hypothetical protein
LIIDGPFSTYASTLIYGSTLISDGVWA